MRKPQGRARLFAGIPWRLRDGVFSKHWDEPNILEVFEQMGAISPRGDSA